MPFAHDAERKLVTPPTREPDEPGSAASVPGAELLGRGYDFSRIPAHSEREADQLADEVADAPADVVAHRLGVDLSGVRVHTGADAAAAAKVAGARAYTLGRAAGLRAGGIRPGAAGWNWIRA